MKEIIEVRFQSALGIALFAQIGNDVSVRMPRIPIESDGDIAIVTLHQQR